MTFYLALSSLLVASAAIGWLVGVNRRLSELGVRVLESEDTKKIIEAADKTAFFESRMAGCEDTTNQSKNQLAAHETKLGELAAKLEPTEQMANRNGTGLAEVSEKMGSFESRMAECENRTEQSENKLPEHETKANELAARLEAVEHMLHEHATNLAQANGSMKVLADGIQSLEEFQTATEKTRNLILTAFNDMQADMPHEECLGARVDTGEPVEISQGPQEEQAEVEIQVDR
jgi:chromosome segregation ATPase